MSMKTKFVSQQSVLPNNSHIYEKKRMKITINKPYDSESLQKDLTSAFPQYKFSAKGKKLLVVKKTNMVGANIMLGKPTHIRVMEAVPNMGSMFLILLLVLLCLLPGVIVMFLAKQKQKVVCNEIGEYIKKNYNTTATPSNSDLLDQ